MAKFGVDDIFTPENPVFAARGGGRQHRPYPAGPHRRDAGHAARPGLRARGQPCPQALVRLEPGHVLPPELDLPVVAAANPYDSRSSTERRSGRCFRARP